MVNERKGPRVEVLEATRDRAGGVALTPAAVVARMMAAERRRFGAGVRTFAEEKGVDVMPVTKLGS